MDFFMIYDVFLVLVDDLVKSHNMVCRFLCLCFLQI